MGPLHFYLLFFVAVWGPNAKGHNPKFFEAVSTGQQPSGPSECQCDLSSVWLDIVFVFDSSQATGKNGLQNMWGFVASLLDFYNVQKTGYQGTDIYTQVGVVTYSNNASVIYPLGSIDLETIDQTFTLPYDGGQLTNLAQGLIVANEQLGSGARRPNTKSVIMVMSPVYNSAGVDAPETTAASIREDGTILIVYNYVPYRGAISPQLIKIASPGYFFLTGYNGTADDINQAMCDANCFCPPNYVMYSRNSERELPTDGCYRVIEIVQNWRFSTAGCQNTANNAGGIQATDTDAQKNAFLASTFREPTSFWIGLNYNSLTSQWQWPDGSALQEYQPWVSFHNGSDPNTAVYVDLNQNWVATDPRNAYYTICQFKPCDSKHYCPGDD